MSSCQQIRKASGVMDTYQTGRRSGFEKKRSAFKGSSEASEAWLAGRGRASKPATGLLHPEINRHKQSIAMVTRGWKP